MARKSRKDEEPVSSIRDAIARERAWIRQSRNQSDQLNQGLHRSRVDAETDLVSQLAKQAGVDFEAVRRQVERRHDVQFRQVQRELGRLQKMVSAEVGRARKQFDRAARYYAAKTAKAYEQAFHNPALRMKIPVDYWAEDTSPPPPMYGGSEGAEIPTTEVVAGADLFPHPVTGAEVATTLHPFLRAEIGHDFRVATATASLSQHLIYQHDPPEDDWFWVDRLWIALSAFGSGCHYRGDKTCLMSEALGGITSYACWCTVRLSQEIGGRWIGWAPVLSVPIESFSTHPPQFIEFEGSITSCAAIAYDQTLTTSSPTSIMLLGRNNGGGPVRVHVEIRCSAQAYFRHAFASIGFDEPGAISIREIAVIPHGE